MPFVYEPYRIGRQNPALVQRQDASRAGAINIETGDYLAYAGRDAKDSTAPTTYFFYDALRRQHWRLEVLEARQAPAAYLRAIHLPAGGGSRLAMLALSLNPDPQQYTIPPYVSVIEALRVFERAPELKVRFVTDWGALHAQRATRATHTEAV